mgnify:CR=1 FL=1
MNLGIGDLKTSLAQIGNLNSEFGARRTDVLPDNVPLLNSSINTVVPRDYENQSTSELSMS